MAASAASSSDSRDSNHVWSILDCSEERKFDGDYDRLCDETCGIDFQTQDDIEPQWQVKVKVAANAMHCFDIRTLVNWLKFKNFEPFTKKKFTQKQLDLLADLYVSRCQRAGERVERP